MTRASLIFLNINPINLNEAERNALLFPLTRDFHPVVALE